MEDSSVKELDLEIDSISNSLISLNESLQSEFEDYILKKSSIFENKNIGKESQELISSFNTSDQPTNTQTQKYICNVNNEMKAVCGKLETTVESLYFIQRMIMLDEGLEKVNQTLDKDYFMAAEHLVNVKCLLEESSKCGRSLDFYKRKTEEYYKLFADLSLKSLEKWNNLISFKSVENENKTKTVSLTVSTSDRELLKSVYQTLELLRVPYKESFCENLLKDFIKPVALHNCKLNNENDGCSKLTIDYSLKSVKMNFTDVVNGFTKIFEFINSSLDLSYERQNSFIGSIGSVIANEFMQLFVVEHLSHKIPLKRIQLVEYERAIEETQILLSVLAAKGFMNDTNQLVKEYFCDAEVVFESKVGSRYKETSVYFMKQDLHDVITIEGVSLEHSMPELRQTIPSEDFEKDYWNNILTLFNNDYRRRSFLQCQVSKSIHDLVVLIHDCLDEASQTNSNLTISLHNSAHEIVYEYLKSPEIHRKLLDIIPQQSALVFTNTMYLIMKLVHFDKEFNTDNLFGELIGQLQNMSFRELNKQVRLQEDIMLSSLQKSGLLDLSELEVFPKTAEKAVRQCLRQVVLLHSVWAAVLPQDIYCIVIGRLINRFIEEIINFIFHARDIREDIANNLVELFSLITEKAPQAFPESREVHRYVKCWLKLREVSLVLAGSLADISERWAGGSGPLAHELEASQVKSLIVALFQSSDIRQRTLTSIR